MAIAKGCSLQNTLKVRHSLVNVQARRCFGGGQVPINVQQYNSAPRTNRGNDSSCISASVMEHELTTTRIYNAARVSWRSHCKLMSATAAVSSTNIDIVVNIEARMRTVAV